MGVSRRTGRTPRLWRRLRVRARPGGDAGACQAGRRAARPGAALAAIRETFERPASGCRARPTGRSAAAPGAHSAGTARRPSRHLAFIARLITPPPHRPQRFDTCFFLAHVDAPSTALESLSGELEEVSWVLLADTHGPTPHCRLKIMLDQIRACLAGDAAPLWSTASGPAAIEGGQMFDCLPG